MKRFCVSVLAMVACLASVAKADEADKFLASISAASQNALAFMSCTLEDETSGGKMPLAGQAICINAEQGLFMTLALDARLKPEMLKEFILVPPGQFDKKVKAELVGIDPETGIGFVRATEKYDWKAVSFVSEAKINPGQKVASVGLLAGDAGNVPYLGLAYVSTLLRVPERLYYVTGGKLTAVGSPVFTEDGKAVGIIARQLPLGYSMATRQGPTGIELVGRQETSFFLPVEEFAHVLKNIPTPGKPKRLGWIGVLRFDPVTPGDYPKTALRADQIIPEMPADKAGLKARDVVVGIDGKDIEKLATPELTVSNFVRQLLRYPVDGTVKLTIMRGTETTPKEIAIKVGELPKRPDEAPRTIDPYKLGVLVREKVDLDQYLDPNPTRDVQGVIVLAVAPDRSAQKAGLQAGDVIQSVDAEKVKTVASLKAALEKAGWNKSVTLMIARGDKSNVAVTVQIPTQASTQPAGGAGANTVPK
jgi:serine protease Do